MDNSELARRAFVKRSATALSGLGVAGLGLPAIGEEVTGAEDASTSEQAPAAATRRAYDGVYEGARLNRVAFPMGGIGAGMVCLEGTGALSHVSIRNQPDVFNAPCIFAAVAIRGKSPASRVLEGPVPGWKIFGARNAANGDEGASYGLPRFERASFKTRFPFGTVSLRDARLPMSAQIVGWSPFTPGDADSSSLPVAALEYRLHNESAQALEGVFSFNAKNFLPVDDKDRRAVRPAERGFTLWSASSGNEPWKEASFTAEVDDPNALVNLAWFRGGWWDPLTMAWRDVAGAAAFARAAVTDGDPSPGATIFVPFAIAAGATRTIVVRLSWYVPRTSLRTGTDPGPKAPDDAQRETHVPWYAGRHDSPAAVASEWRTRYAELRQRSEQFAKAFYDSTLPPEVIDAVAANLTILKSPTVMRQRDGRLWAWEGCSDENGCCSGTCTHVWNYAQAIPHLFPSLERTLRETEFGPSQDERGHQAFRTALPIRLQVHDFHAASDGQLGGIMKVHRDWRVSGDNEWLRALWPKVRASLDYCMETWDPERKGWLEEPHHNTYDIEFWGPEPMCTSFYLGALAAAVAMGKSLGDDVTRYADVLAKGAARVERELFNGEYFIQKVEFEQLRASKAEDKENLFGLKNYSPEARALLEKEGPKYQYGTGCLSDGVLGAWMAMVCGVGEVLDRAKVTSHLR